MEVQYDSFGWRHEDAVWTPVRQGLNPTAAYSNPDTLPIPGNPDSLRDSDADATGQVFAATRLVTTAEQTPYGWADLGLYLLNAGITLVKGSIDDYETGQTTSTTAIELDRIHAEPPLDVNPPQLRADLPLGPVNLGRIADGDEDPRTQAYGFVVANPGSAPMGGITLSDITTAGNPAVLGTVLEITRAGGTTEAARLVEGQVQLPDGTPATLAAGESVRGYFHVGFSDTEGDGSDLHSNEMSVNAQVLSDTGEVISTLTDRDPFSASYEAADPLALTLRKVSAYPGATGSYDVGLHGATIRVENTDLEVLPTVEEAGRVIGEVGTFRTDKDGFISLESLPAGVYRISEDAAPAGYQLPRGVWYVRLNYEDDGTPNIKAQVIGAQPFAEAVGTTDGTAWGQVALLNLPRYDLPRTGGYAWVIIVSGIALVLLGGAWLVSLRRR